MTLLAFERPPHVHLGCYSYFGFGSGYVMARERNSANPNEGRSKKGGRREGYCNSCPWRDQCWAEHHSRVSALRPGEVAEFRKILTAMGEDGIRAVNAWKAGHKGVDEPFMDMMLQNMEDGARRWTKQPPRERGGETLPDPFPPLPPELANG